MFTLFARSSVASLEDYQRHWLLGQEQRQLPAVRVQALFGLLNQIVTVAILTAFATVWPSRGFWFGFFLTDIWLTAALVCLFMPLLVYGMAITYRGQSADMTALALLRWFVRGQPPVWLLEACSLLTMLSAGLLSYLDCRVTAFAVLVNLVVWTVGYHLQWHYALAFLANLQPWDLEVEDEVLVEQVAVGD